MLQEKLNECRVLIAEVSQNKQIDLENQNIARKNNTFFDAYSKWFVPTVKSYVVCRKYDYIEFSDSVIDDIKKVIEYSKRTFEQKIVVNPVKYQDSVKKLSERIEKEWKKQTDEYLANVKEELGILKLVSNEKQEIQKIITIINNFSNWPVDEVVALQYDSARKRADQILSKMEFDDEIERFLIKVKNKEASLLDLTDSIIAWIRREGLAENIMLGMKN